jgi:hypothetical protein
MSIFLFSGAVDEAFWYANFQIINIYEFEGAGWTGYRALAKYLSIQHV